jgi:hypothetical protein
MKREGRPRKDGPDIQIEEAIVDNVALLRNTNGSKPWMSDIR